ncbi:MAG: FAD-dependent oxidoreductase, partial [Clostridia bacterium]|nr:FAD-dependent oxidoreductase [Clostridia bacterium]
MRYVTLPASKIPVIERSDVVVVGGGVAGIAAALAATRAGARTVLLEREFALGGLATLGLITYYLPLCDGMGNQVSFGIAEELLRAAIAHGAEADYPAAWMENKCVEERAKGSRFTARHNGPMLALSAERILLDAGVRIFYGCMVRNAIVENGKISCVIFESKSGASAIEATAFVDASGDADLVHMSGERTRRFAQGNILAAWYYSVDANGLSLNPLGACDVPEEYKDGDGPQLLSHRRFSGLDCLELSEMVCLSHDV